MPHKPGSLLYVKPRPHDTLVARIIVDQINNSDTVFVGQYSSWPRASVEDYRLRVAYHWWLGNHHRNFYRYWSGANRKREATVEDIKRFGEAIECFEVFSIRSPLPYEDWLTLPATDIEHAKRTTGSVDRFAQLFDRQAERIAREDAEYEAWKAGYSAPTSGCRAAQK